MNRRHLPQSTVAAALVTSRHVLLRSLWRARSLPLTRAAGCLLSGLLAGAAATVSTAAERAVFPDKWPTRVELDINETRTISRNSGAPHLFKLLAISHQTMPYRRNAADGTIIYAATVEMEVDGSPVKLIARPYQFPTAVGGLRMLIENTKTWSESGTVAATAQAKDLSFTFTHVGESWGPADAHFPIGSFRWHATTYHNTWMGLVPQDDQVYYHRGEDFGAQPNLLPVLAPCAGAVTALPSVRLCDANDAVYQFYHMFESHIYVTIGQNVEAGFLLAHTGGHGNGNDDQHLHVTVTAPDGTVRNTYPMMAEAYLRDYPDSGIANAGGYQFMLPGQTITLDASRSLARPGRTITGYCWILHDGTEVTGCTANLTLAAPGYFAQELRVTYDDGSEQRDFTPVRVFSAGDAGQAGMLGFIYQHPVRAIKPGTPVTLMHNSWMVGVNSRTIDFGDGSSPQVVAGHKPAMTHAYAAPGLYTVTISVGTSQVLKTSVLVEGAVPANTPPLANAGPSPAAIPPATASQVTPLQWLQHQTRPAFKPGHTLPRLGQMHCVNPPPELRAELARHWGFAVRLSRPTGEAELLRLCAEEPAMFRPAAMIGNLANLEGSQSIHWPEGTFLRKADGSLVDGKQIFSPEMPDAAWQILVDDALRQIEGQLGGLPAASLAMVENWTEHGLHVPFNVQGRAQHDPHIVAAKGQRSWQAYVSQRKADYEGRLREAVKRQYPNALYTCYTYSGFTGKAAGDWAWDYHHLKSATDLPSPECYYNYFNSGFVGGKDMLTLRLHARHIEIQEGSPHYLGWLCAGYERKITDYQGDPAQGMFSDAERWMGYLKMSYLAGMLGGITTGEFGCEVRYEPFDPAQPPKWLDQMLVVAHAHALFTWIEGDLRHSQLLPGPQQHAWSRDHPAYEFPTGHKDTRVLVRRVNGTARWLIGAWAADCIERETAVTIPDLGEYRLRARPAGTIHRVELQAGRQNVTWLDEDGMKPSLRLKQRRP